MSIRDPGPNRSSDVIDAILGKVADNRSRTDTTNALFRAKALDQLDITADIDNQLPLVSRRNWLLLVGAALIVIAFVAWAALTPATQAVSGAGRVLAPSGLLSVTSPASGIIVELNATSGDLVEPGDAIATVQAGTEQVPIASIVAGTTWQVTESIGSPVTQGEVLATLLPARSESTALVVLPDQIAEAVRPGMDVNADGDFVGTVVAVQPPLRAEAILQRTGISVPEGQLASIVEVELDQPAEPGRSTVYTITLSSQPILEQILSR